MRLIAPLFILFSPLFSWLYYIDQPDYTSLFHGEYLFSLRLQDENGIIGSGYVGLFDRFTIGLSYGGLRLLGEKTPEWYPRVEFRSRIVILPESEFYPQLIFGFDSQGYGKYEEGYETPPKGFFLALGKNFELFQGTVGVNKRVGKDKKFDGFCGGAVGIGTGLLFLGDYSLQDGLNLGIELKFMETLSLRFSIRDILGKDGFDRIVEIGYKESF